MPEQPTEASPTTKRRDEFWAQGVRGLFLINGGGAVALLTFLQAIWTTERAMVIWVVWGLVFMAFGVASAAAIPILRSKTAEYWKSRPRRGRGYKRAYETLSAISVCMFFISALVLALGTYRVVA